MHGWSENLPDFGLGNLATLRDYVFAKFASAIICLICYYVCAETTTVVLLALILYKIKFSALGFVHNLIFAGF